MKKRNQINVTLEDSEFETINEYCRVHDRTPQWLLKVGAQKIIEEDFLEHKADIMTLQSWREIQGGLSEPIDDLLEMIIEDKRLGNEVALLKLKPARKYA
jgi:hypothetical protein